MSASLLSENSSCMNGGVGDDDDVLKHNLFVLMSLLEETSQGEHDQTHYNDEELQNMIRSLEAEIYTNTNTNTKEEEEYDFAMESRLMLIDDVEFVEGKDYCWENSINDLDNVIQWNIDDDLKQASSSSPSDELNLCMDYFYGNDDQFDTVIYY